MHIFKVLSHEFFLRPSRFLLLFPKYQERDKTKQLLVRPLSICPNNDEAVWFFLGSRFHTEGRQATEQH